MKETQVFGSFTIIFTSKDFLKTQNFIGKPLIFQSKTQIFGQKLRFSAISKLGVGKKVGKKKPGFVQILGIRASHKTVIYDKHGINENQWYTAQP